MGFFRRTEAPPPPPTEEPAAELPVADPQPRAAATEPPAEPPKKQGWFQRLKAGLTKTSARLSEDIAGLFTKRKLDADSLQELEDLLIQADLGVETAMRITEALAKGRYNKEIAPEEVRAVLAAEVERALAPVAKPLRLDGQHRPHVILVVGVNGTGKTTTIGKLAHKLSGEGKKVTLAAGDTFRAAAVEQLQIWGERTGAEVVARAVGADSAGLAYDALGRARENGSDVLLIDTAGRLQNKQALMDELEKVIRVLRKIDSLAPHQVLLVLDATTGQNALNQVEIFKEKAGVTGLVMTKLDGTARGGILVAISAKFGLPVHAIGIGEGVEDLAGFDANEFARAIALS
jgi:fused signal recognition particle receptor